MDNNIWNIVAYVACFLVWIRFLPYLHLDLRSRLRKNTSEAPLVSIIVPVRNEAHRIGRLLDSLLQIAYPNIEIIVADDSSEDHTRQIAEQYAVTVIDSGRKPGDWMGKSWACHQAYLHSRGKYLLFTDADTVHTPESLRRAMYFMQRTKSQFISAPSYHLCDNWWEKLLGPFYFLLHAGASPYDPINARNAYAIGQYLLIDRKAYKAIGGHEIVKSELAEDTSLARATMNAGFKYRIYKGGPLCKVQMFTGFREFMDGWTRLLRLGMKELNPLIVILSLLPILALNFWNLDTMTWEAWTPALLTVLCMALVQHKIGRFNILGILLVPVNVILFVIIGLAACMTQLLQIPISWRGRTYHPA